MRVRIGSKNPAKIEAAQETLAKFRALENSLIEVVEAPSGIPEQPFGLEQTLLGAKNRAKNAFEKKTLGIGIESGLLVLEQHPENAFVIAACAAFDGKNHFAGFSPAFELPKNLTQKILQEKIGVDKAAHALGITENPRIGYGKGLIHLFSNKRISRKDLLKHAVVLALSRWEQQNKYF